MWERERSSAAVMAKAIDPIQVVVHSRTRTSTSQCDCQQWRRIIVGSSWFVSFVRSFVQKLRFLFSVVVESQIKILTYFASQRVFVWSLVHLKINNNNNNNNYYYYYFPSPSSFFNRIFVPKTFFNFFLYIGFLGLSRLSY